MAIRETFAPDISDVKKFIYIYHGNIAAIAREMNISRETMYQYLKKNPEAAELIQNVRGFNTETDLDLAEYVIRHSLINHKDNPALAVRCAEKVVDKKGRSRGWSDDTTIAVSPNQSQNDKEDIEFNLQAELVKSRQIIRFFKEKYGDCDTFIDTDIGANENQ
jgi:hypothetical protein